MSEVSVVLPTLNEAGNISLLFERLVKALGNGFEAVLVDDGSTDGTVEEARQAARNFINEVGLGSALARFGVTVAPYPGCAPLNHRLIPIYIRTYRV